MAYSVLSGARFVRYFPIGSTLRTLHRKAAMSAPCIHGFSEAQCASCRPCPHGLTSGRCGRCIAAAAATPRKVAAASAANAPGPEERGGFQIFYVPELSGWQYRDPDDRTSPVSYRSLFLARKAVDEVAARLPDKKAAGGDGSRATRSASTA
jgi:hypothetical protein